jgi:hypothetical protein
MEARITMQGKLLSVDMDKDKIFARGTFPPFSYT